MHQQPFRSVVQLPALTDCTAAVVQTHLLNQNSEQQDYCCCEHPYGMVHLLFALLLRLFPRHASRLPTTSTFPLPCRHEPYNLKVDVYSFAMIIFQLFETTTPFHGHDPVDAARQAAMLGARPGFPPRRNLTPMTQVCV
jgi:hypothetical protein